MDKKEFGKNQVVRIKETHTSNGIELVQGTLAWIFTGETYGALAPNEIAIQFKEDGPFVGVDKSKIEPYTDDPLKLHLQIESYFLGEEKLRQVEQRYKDIGTENLAKAVNGLRKHFYLKAMVGCLKADPVEAVKNWEEIEEQLRTSGTEPYRINVTSETVN